MRRRLLLVEDDDAIREIARISLERVGDWKVHDAASGDLALEVAAREGPFSAVLLDVMMPGVDGPETMRRLRNSVLNEDTPIVFLTAKQQTSDRERLQALGATGVIAKPFDPMQLPEELDRVLGTQR